MASNLPNKSKSGKAHAFSLLNSGRIAEARAMLADYCRGHARDAEAIAALGIADGMLGNLVSAESNLRTALRLLPNEANIHFNLGKALQGQGKLAEARASYSSACRLRPGVASFHNNLANVLKDLGLPREALTHAMRAAELEPSNASHHYNLGLILSSLGQREQSIGALKRALQRNPELLDARCALGNALLAIGETDEALDAYDRVLDRQPAHPAALCGKAGALNILGRFKEASSLLNPLLADKPDANAVITLSQFAHHVDREEEAIRLAESALGNSQTRNSDRARLCFSLGQLNDRRGSYDTAFEYYRQGNELGRKDFNLKAVRDYFSDLKEIFSAEYLAQAKHASNSSDLPVFIVGMPRSGTTLVEQILSRHESVHGAGELDHVRNLYDQLPMQRGKHGNVVSARQAALPLVIDEFARSYLDKLAALAPGAKHIIDKMPGNFMYLGLIDLMFPNARIIHCQRNPLDTCLSCYFQDFSGDHPYANDLASLGNYYLEYVRLMDYWRSVLRVRMLEVRYEDLATNLASAAPGLLEFCGLDWEEAYLDFHTKKRTVVTASYDQVRRGIYTSSVERYRNYEKHIAVLKDMLGDGLIQDGKR